MGKPAKKEESASGAPVIDRCIGEACKAQGERFGFCAEHFDQYKFGLINKKGLPVPDYEKKLGHYQAFKQKVAAHKVA